MKIFIKQSRYFQVAIILTIMSCQKEPIYLGPLTISTNKQVYKTTEPVIVEVINYTDSIAVYLSHIFHNIYPLVYHYDNGKWSGYWADYVLNNKRGNKELLPGLKIRDTLQIDFETGTYRINYLITMRPNSYPRNFYSNIFIVED